MILDAYYKNFAVQMCGNPNSLTFKDYNNHDGVYGRPRDDSNIAIIANDGLWFGKMTTILTSYNGYGVVFGDGTTEVSKDDNKLSGNVITTISGTAVSQDTCDDAQAIKSTLFTITNTGTEPVTISEIGYFGAVGFKTFYTNAMFERTLLETPVTIPPGGVGRVIYTIRLNYPTA